MTLSNKRIGLTNSKWHFIVFCLLEILCLYLVISNNNNQKLIFDNTFSIVSNKVYQNTFSLSNYIKLEQVVDSLLVENSNLIEELNNKKMSEMIFDSEMEDLFSVYPAKVIYKSRNKIKNHIIINKGKNQGLILGGGVIADNGVIGIIVQLSDDFAKVMTFEHEDSRLSVKILGHDYFGPLKWKEWSDNEFYLDDFPSYLELHEGDTIVTSGMSTIFPANLMVGTINSYQSMVQNDKYLINLSMFKNIKAFDYVYAIKNNYNQQLDSLISNE